MTISPHPTQTVRGAEAIQTDGIGIPTTAHLNLTVTMADLDKEARERLLDSRAARSARRTTRPYRPRAYRQLRKIGYAGREAI